MHEPAVNCQVVPVLATDYAKRCPLRLITRVASPTSVMGYGNFYSYDFEPTSVPTGHRLMLLRYPCRLGGLIFLVY